MEGELLRVLCDSLLRENMRTRQFKDATVTLTATAARQGLVPAVLSHELRRR